MQVQKDFLDNLYIITSALFFIFLFRNILFWVFWWQIKEYRLDRLKIHLFETKQGKDLFFSFGNIIKVLAFFAYFVVIFQNKLFIYYSIFVFIIYLLSFLKVLEEIINRRLRMPILTLKSLALFTTTVLIICFLFIFPLVDNFFWLVLLDRLTPIIVGILVGFSSVPSDFYKDLIIGRAIEKRNKFKDLLVIGITGSYGKGSTKEFVSSILAQKFNVLKTFGTYNTPIGIAKTILSGLNEKKEIFVVEMGAYKIGEIREMCSMVHPKIGILTAVNDQHKALFKSVENTMKAKYELIESIPYNGLCLFNANNQNSNKLGKKTRKNKIMYFVDYENQKPDNYDLVATNIKNHKFYINFDVIFKGKDMIKGIRVNLIGQHNLENLLSGIFISRYLGMNKNDIKNAILKIKPIIKTMYPYTNKKGTVLIDDSYNSNPEAVLAAVNYMKIYNKGKKVLVFQPMIELGDNASVDHYEIAKVIGQVCNYLIVTNDNFIKDIKKGIDESKGKCEIMIASPKKIADFIENKLCDKDVVVFEGKESNLSFSLLESEKVYSSGL